MSGWRRCALREDQDPLAAIRHYIQLKLEVSRDHPQASRLFCLEMLQGAPLLKAELEGDLKALIDEKSRVIENWIVQKRLAPVEPQHLIFMLWATTQHYADFSAQVEAITGRTLNDEEFFQQAVANVQHMVIEGIRIRRLKNFTFSATEPCRAYSVTFQRRSKHGFRFATGSRRVGDDGCHGPTRAALAVGAGGRVLRHAARSGCVS